MTSVYFDLGILTEIIDRLLGSCYRRRGLYACPYDDVRRIAYASEYSARVIRLFGDLSFAAGFELIVVPAADRSCD